MAKKREKSAVEIQYEKERKRLTQQVRRMEKRGYVFKETPIPKKPKKIDEGSVRNLQKRTTSYLYGKAKYVEKETGKQISAEEGRKQERKRAQEKAKETRKRKKEEPTEYIPSISIIEAIEDAILRIPSASYYGYQLSRNNEPEKMKLISMLNDRYAIAEQNGTEQQYTEYLINNQSDILECTNAIIYSSDQDEILYQFARLGTLITGQALTMSESAELTEFSEYYEDYDY